MFFHDAIADAETKARSLAYRLRGVERIENPVRIFHARAAIGNFDAQPVP